MKLFGCEKRTAQESPIQSWKWIVPSVVCAAKSGAVSPIVSSIRYLLLSSDPNDRVEGVANSSAQSRKTSVSLRLFLFLCVPAGEHALAVTTAQRSHLF